MVDGSSLVVNGRRCNDGHWWHEAESWHFEVVEVTGNGVTETVSQEGEWSWLFFVTRVKGGAGFFVTRVIYASFAHEVRNYQRPFSLSKCSRK